MWPPKISVDGRERNGQRQRETEMEKEGENICVFMFGQTEVYEEKILKEEICGGLVLDIWNQLISKEFT